MPITDKEIVAACGRLSGIPLPEIQLAGYNDVMPLWKKLFDLSWPHFMAAYEELNAVYCGGGLQATPWSLARLRMFPASAIVNVSR